MYDPMFWDCNSCYLRYLVVLDKADGSCSGTTFEKAHKCNPRGLATQEDLLECSPSKVYQQRKG